MEYMLLDITAGAKFITKAPLQHIQLHARLWAAQAPGKTYIAPPVEARSFAKLSQDQLLHLIYDLGAAPNDAADYTGMCEQALGLVQAEASASNSLESLQREASRIQHVPPVATDVPKRPVHGEAEPVAKTPREPKPKQERQPRAPADPNSIGRPKAGSATGRVWEMADSLKAKLERLPTRKELQDALPDVNASTVSVQYGKWKILNGA